MKYAVTIEWRSKLTNQIRRLYVPVSALDDTAACEIAIRYAHEQGASDKARVVSVYAVTK